MSNDKMDTSKVYTLFETINGKLDKLPVAAQSAPIPASAPILDPEDTEKIEILTSKLDSVGEKLDRPLQHHHTFDFMSNKALIALVAAVVALFVSLWGISNQRQTITQFRDNDLKYRYIQMRGEAAPADIFQLRNVFEFNRNADSIKTIRRQVERYEQLIQQQAENEARAKLNNEQSKQLKQEINALKN